MYELFEHTADMGVRGIADTLEGAFEECAKAMFSVMVKLDEVEAKDGVEIEVSAADTEALLVEWLNALLYEADVKKMFFSEFKVEGIEENDGEFVLKGTARGEAQDEEKHQVKTEVKAATYSQLKAEKKNNKYFVQCIVDV